MSIFSNLLCGVCGPNDEDLSIHKYEQQGHSEDELAAEIVKKLYTTEKSGKALRLELQEMVQTSGWKEYLAEKVLNTLEYAVKTERNMGPVLKDAYDKAWEEVRKIEGFQQDHPIIFTLVAMGIMLLLTPWLLELLGFVDGDIVAGSWIARWMSRYGGIISRKSLLSYAQRLASRLQR